MHCAPGIGPYSARPFVHTQPPDFMSQHRSLKGASTIAAKRNVLKRFERVELLKKRGQFKAGDKVIGLRKTKPEA
jgi:small basic protein (TIGR04137 family)